MATDKTVARRQYSAVFKAQVLVECEAPGASVARVAMSHGVNANIVHGWRQIAREAGRCNAAATIAPFEPRTPSQTQFLPVLMAGSAPQAAALTPGVAFCLELERA